MTRFEIYFNNTVVLIEKSIKNKKIDQQQNKTEELLTCWLKVNDLNDPNKFMTTAPPAFFNTFLRFFYTMGI